MRVGERPQKTLAQNYRKNIMHGFAEQFNEVAGSIMHEATGCDLYYDPRRALNNRLADEALKNFFIEGSFDPEGTKDDEINNHCANPMTRYPTTTNEHLA